MNIQVVAAGAFDNVRSREIRFFEEAARSGDDVAHR